MTRFQHLRIPSFLALAVLFASCASTPSAPEGGALLVTLHNYRGGEQFELASESHTERIAYYSSARGDASRKVQTDEVMSAFLRELQRLGLEEHARAGHAPDAAQGEVIRWGLEVASADRSVHWLIGAGSKPEDWKAFEQCRDTFLQLYNSTVSYQTVQNDEGKAFFEERPRSASAPEPR